MFFFINGLILFVWNWPVHDWVRRELFDASNLDKTYTFAILFFFLWVESYLVSALTPLWTRTLEGKNWWGLLRSTGIKKHLERYNQIEKEIEEAVRVYVEIQRNRPRWDDEIVQARQDSATKATEMPSVSTEESIKKLTDIPANSTRLVKYEDIDDLINTYCSEIRATKNRQDLEHYSNDITLLIEDTYRRALQEHSRLVTDRNLEFGNREDVLPTRFGNVGMSAQAFAMRAYQCNLGLIWSSLRRAIAKEQETATSLENCKSQLDFFVACYWLSLFQAVGWAVAFAVCGEPVGAISSAIAGPAICWMLWYGAAVEQYRVLQSLLISCLNSPLRHQVLNELRIALPADIAEERELWQSINMAIGFGDPRPLRYQYPKT